MKLFESELRHFPHPHLASADGLLEVSDHINTAVLLEAYSFGIYPWPYEGLPILWFSPPERGILDFKDLRVPRSFLKLMRNPPFELRVNTSFAEVIERCADQPRPGQTGSWITPRMKRAYMQFHKDGYAHCFEAWRDGELVGGLYGVYVGGVFAGESMYYDVPNASKFCLYSLLQILKARGDSWMDIQMVTPLLKQWGGKYISRDELLQRLERAHERAQIFEPHPV